MICTTNFGIRKFDAYKYQRRVIDFGKHTEKVCPSCKRKLSLDNFYDATKKDKPDKKYKYSRCKECVSFESHMRYKKSKIKQPCH